jgi:methylated-DNA-[protein]-cysteine S-methyltransferase
MSRLTVDAPVGRLSLTEGERAITRLDWGGTGTDETPLLVEARRQLNAYFAGDLQRFSLRLAPRATPFQHIFYEALFAIRFGETSTYGDIATALDVSPQAVGRACGANPIPILIPCHRVVGARGLGGYSGAGGIATKHALLRHEGAAL